MTVYGHVRFKTCSRKLLQNKEFQRKLWEPPCKGQLRNTSFLRAQWMQALAVQWASMSWQVCWWKANPLSLSSIQCTGRPLETSCQWSGRCNAEWPFVRQNSRAGPGLKWTSSVLFLAAASTEASKETGISPVPLPTPSPGQTRVRIVGNVLSILGQSPPHHARKFYHYPYPLPAQARPE